MSRSLDLNQTVLVFDGVCVFCNASVNLILEKERHANILFAAYQSEAGKEILLRFGCDPKNIDTVYFLENGKLYDRSTAALKVARHLKFPWYLATIFFIVPAFFRNPVYNFIASHRYQWFGKLEACRMPKENEKNRFLG